MSRLTAISCVEAVGSEPIAVPVTVDEAETLPVLLVVTVTSLETPGLRSITVIKPVDEIEAVPPLEAEILQVKEESKLVTWARNPVAVEVVALKIGRSGASRVLPVTVAAPFSKPFRAVEAEMIALEPTSIPVMVSNPEPPRDI